MRFQLHPVRRAASKCSNGVSPVDLANAYSPGLAICPVPRVRCRRLTCNASYPAAGFHEPPVREVNPVAGVVATGLREIRSQGNSKLHEASDCRKSLALLREKSVPALPCEREHADGDWEDLLIIMTSLPAPPNRIVFSRLAEEALWPRVLNLGDFDRLRKPVEPYIKESMTFSLRRLKVMAIDFRRWKTFEMRPRKRTQMWRTGNGICVQPCGSPSPHEASGSAAMLPVPLGRRKRRVIGECPDFRTN